VAYNTVVCVSVNRLSHLCVKTDKAWSAEPMHRRRFHQGVLALGVISAEVGEALRLVNKIAVIFITTLSTTVAKLSLKKETALQDAATVRLARMDLLLGAPIE